MIDIHSHVLWGLDDGADTVEDSLALLEAAAASGTTEIVATPHASPDYPYDEVLVRHRFEDLRSRVSEPRLHLGCDFHLTFDNIEDALLNPRRYTICGGPYLLVEFSDLMIFRSTESDFARLREAGMVPVITHPERNPLLRQRIQLLANWVEQGCLLQVTGASYLGRFGKKACRVAHELTAAGLVHVVASDAHDVRRRPPDLREPFAHVGVHYGEAAARLLFYENPAAILRGEPVTAARPQRASVWRRVARVFGF